MAGLFLQALKLCQAAGLVKLGHVALDGTKLQANASKHKAMSYGRMREAEARQKAEQAKTAAEAKIAERRGQEDQTGRKIGGRPAQVPDPKQAKPEDQAQRNFTDPDSRIMPDGAHKGSFVQAYNARIAVDAEAQIIVAMEMDNEAPQSADNHACAAQGTRSPVR